MHYSRRSSNQSFPAEHARVLVPFGDHLEWQADQPEDPGRKVTGQGWGSTGEELAELRR